MSNDEEEFNEEYWRKEKRRQKSKEKILDDTFNKAIISRGKLLKKRDGEKIKKTVERPFLKSGILLIIVAIVALVFVNYSPWMYVNHEVEDGVVEELFYRDFDDEADINQTILNLFWSPCKNCSNNSQNYIGLTFDDFSNSPRTISNCFMILILLGIIFTVFVIINKFRRFYDEIIFAFHSLFSIVTIMVSVVILTSSIKFLGTYFLIYHNWSFIKISGINQPYIVFLTPIIIVILSLAIIRGCIATFKINFREMEKKFIHDKSEKSFSTYLYGRNTK